MPQYPLHPANTGTAPAAIYAARLGSCQSEAARLGRRNLLLSYGRLLWAVAAIITAWYVFGRHLLSWPVLLLPVAAFGITARLHSAALAAATRQARAIAWYGHGIARLEDRWAGRQPRATPAAAAQSLYAADLDLFGPGSLFELLCTTRTSLGEAALAEFLLNPVAAEEVKARQAAVADLRDRVPLREAFAGADGPSIVSLHSADLSAWGEAENTLPRIFQWLAPALALLTVAAAVFWGTGHSAALLSLALLINGTVTFALRGHVKPLLEGTEQAAQPLLLLAELFSALERETFSAEQLCAGQALLLPNREPASGAIGRLSRLAGAAEQRANLFARLLDFGLLYSVHVALLVGSWRHRYGTHLRSWFQAFAEIEALLALSTYHFEHPEDPFPEIATDLTFEARALGHPLLPQSRCVRNDLTLDVETQLLIISGSNMSGKSTLLRASGVACVMSLAGCPVRAASLRLSPMRVAASIQVQDSLQGGRSRFYAEILRLRAVCELARRQPPVLFLLDELLAGTNSHDRLAGAAGVVESLLRAGALGLLSTHDLALTQLGAELQTVVRNAHFEDRIEGDGLQFDYTLREGIITRSNGLELMRLIGLNV